MTPSALRSGIRDGRFIRWPGGAGAMLPSVASVSILVVRAIKGWPAIRGNGLIRLVLLLLTVTGRLSAARSRCAE